MEQRNYRILAVDDNEIHCYSLYKLLSHAGFDVQRAHSGSEALQHLAEVRPDAVLLDIGMPEMNGFEVCNAIRAEKQYNGVAIVFHSASGHLAGSPTTSGADAYLTYPVNSEHLISVLRGCIQRRIDTNPTVSKGATPR